MAFAPRAAPNLPNCLRLPILVFASFDHPGTDENPLLAKFRIAHPLLIPFEIVRFELEDLR